MADDEPITRERWLIEQVLLGHASVGHSVNILAVVESVHSVALAEGWDLAETKTRAEWVAS